ncbi:MAG: RNA polymerase sigma factor [Fimbriimonas sp.]|nr:RNA polymerase sigma factor [Fimbriimonas sp.]
MSEQRCDDELIRRAANGDTDSFDLLVRRYQHPLQRFAARMLGGDSDTASDIAVGAFLRLWENRRTFVPAGSTYSWLIRAAFRLCIDHIESSRRNCCLNPNLPSAQNVDSRVESNALAQAVRDAVMSLPVDQRAVLILSTYEGLSYDEIATSLDIPTGTVGSRKNHALTALRRRLASWAETRNQP